MGKRLDRFDYFFLIAGPCLFAGALQIVGKMLSERIFAQVPDYAASSIGFFKVLLGIIFCVASYKYVLAYLYHKATKRSYFKDRVEFRRPYGVLKQFYMTADPYRLNEETLPVERWQDAEGVILGKIGCRLIKRPSSGVGNLAAFALPGGGKTTSQIIGLAVRFWP